MLQLHDSKGLQKFISHFLSYIYFFVNWLIKLTRFEFRPFLSLHPMVLKVHPSGCKHQSHDLPPPLNIEVVDGVFCHLVNPSCFKLTPTRAIVVVLHCLRPETLNSHL